MGSLVRPVSLPPLAAALRSGERDVSAYAVEVCDRIDEADPIVRAFVAEPGRRERLAGEARAAAGRWPDPASRPALYGVPVGIKDVVRVDGLPMCAGSALPAEVFAGAQAGVVDRLRAAGALVAGKTATAEFAMAAPGPTRNPHHPGHTPGGSSSGSAAAVAAGMAPLAIGTQTIGSVVRPAAYCGVVGFKPTYGRIPVDGVVANAPSFDTLGLFAVDVTGVALGAACVCDGWRPVVPDRPPVLGIPIGSYVDRAGPEAVAGLARHVGLLRAAGLDVREVPAMADFEEVAAALHLVNRYEFARTHAEWFPRFGHLYRPQSAAGVEEGRRIGQPAYEDALRRRDRFRDAVLAAMDTAGVDLWLTPATTGPAPQGLDSTGDPVMSMPWSSIGAPCVTVPLPGAGPLPLGIQLVGRPGDDELLLAYAALVERA